MSRFKHLWKYWYVPRKDRPPYYRLDLEKAKDFLTTNIKYKTMAEGTNKDTKEFLSIPAKLTDSIYQSTADGEFHPLKDFTNFLDDLLAIQPGLEGLDNVKTENATMPIVLRDELEPHMMQQMPNVPETDRYDFAKAGHGLLSIFRIGWRKGYEKGREEALKELSGQ